VVIVVVCSVLLYFVVECVVGCVGYDVCLCGWFFVIFGVVVCCVF
jgi:hypothetical protein